MRAQKKNDVPLNILNFDKVIPQLLIHLRLCGLLPLKGKDFNSGVTNIILCCCFILVVTMVYMFTIYGYNYVKQVQFLLNLYFNSCMISLIRPKKYFKGGVLGLDYICEFNSVIFYALRFIMMVVVRKQLSKHLNECRILWDSCTANERDSVLLFVKKIQIVFVCDFFSLNVLTVVYAYTAATVTLPPIEPNSTEIIRQLPLRLVRLIANMKLYFYGKVGELS